MPENSTNSLSGDVELTLKGPHLYIKVYFPELAKLIQANHEGNFEGVVYRQWDDYYSQGQLLVGGSRQRYREDTTISLGLGTSDIPKTVVTLLHFENALSGPMEVRLPLSPSQNLVAEGALELVMEKITGRLVELVTTLKTSKVVRRTFEFIVVLPENTAQPEGESHA